MNLNELTNIKVKTTAFIRRCKQYSVFKVNSSDTIKMCISEEDH